MPQVSIFIVEDELIEAEDIRLTLERQGYQVAGIGRSGEELLDMLKTTRPDLILMDLHLAGPMDGIDTAGQVHTLYKIPVIFLTAHADEASIERAKVTEPYGYVLKPFDERELHSSIEMAIYKHRTEMQAQEQARIIRILADTIPDPVILISGKRQIIAYNDAMLRRIGHDPGRVMGKASVLFDRTGEFTTLPSQIDLAMQTGRPVLFEEVAGEEWFEVAIHPVPGAGPDDPWVLVHYHNITDRKRFEDQIKREGMARIEQNMEQFQILNDQIRNPLQAIMGYVSLDCIAYRERIIEQIGMIDRLVDQLDHGWVESEKVRRFLMRHYHNAPQDGSGEDACKQREAGG